MADLTPDTGARLGRLLPRLASDAPGEVVATVAAIRRTLDRAGLDLHDLAARLGELTPTEGAHIIALVETYRRTLERTELEARVAALEGGRA